MALRRIVFIILIVLLAVIAGGGAGIGVAYFIIKKQLENVQVNIQAKVDTTRDTTSSLVDTTLNKVVNEVKSEQSKVSKDELAARDTSQAQKVSETLPVSTEQSQTSQPKQETLSLNLQKTETPAQPKTSITIPDIKAPTINLGESNLSGNINLQPTKSTPTMPNITPSLSGGLSLSIETLKEEDIKEVYYTQGNISKAESMVNNALKKNPNDEVAKKYLSMIKLEKTALSLEAQGDMEGAKRVWKQILSIDPNHPRAKAKAQ